MTQLREDGDSSGMGMHGNGRKTLAASQLAMKMSHIHEYGQDCAIVALPGAAATLLEGAPNVGLKAPDLTLRLARVCHR